VAETISLPHLRRWFPTGLLVGDRERRVAAAAIERLRIRASGPRARLASLSGGNQQKVVLARWQAEPARVLLLDEPFQGVDVGARADLIAALRAERTTATLVATSDPEEALPLADRIFIMERQRLTPWDRAGVAA
jgi:simple sugar transport system ATP-binding protein